jgi:hypothetical protein
MRILFALINYIDNCSMFIFYKTYPVFLHYSYCTIISTSVFSHATKAENVIAMIGVHITYQQNGFLLVHLNYY